MAPPGSSQTLLSPAELSFLHTSLSSTPPIRPDLRTPTQFRPLVAETAILPATNGSARICFSDGTEAIVGIKAEVGKTPQQIELQQSAESSTTHFSHTPSSLPAPIELSIEIPSHRDDDPLPTFLSSMLTETLLASSSLRESLHINERWHWKLYIDILLLSAPLSYPLPLLSLTTHLALLNTALPRLKSDPGDDPLFDDDWAAAVPLFPNTELTASSAQRPPITLLVMTVAENIIFDPSTEELAVAESVLAVTVAATGEAETPLKLLAIRMVDPPSRLTPPGVPDKVNPATAAGAAATTGGTAGKQQQKVDAVASEEEKAKVWSPPRGGIKRGLVARVIKMVLKKGGVGEEVLEGLAGVET
jgi:exosome complex component RRP42